MRKGHSHLRACPSHIRKLVIAAESVAAAELCEQSQHLDVEPDEGDHESSSADPLHVLRLTGLDPLLDVLEIHNQEE